MFTINAWEAPKLDKVTDGGHTVNARAKGRGRRSSEMRGAVCMESAMIGFRFLSSQQLKRENPAFPGIGCYVSSGFFCFLLVKLGSTVLQSI